MEGWSMWCCMVVVIVFDEEKNVRLGQEAMDTGVPPRSRTHTRKRLKAGSKERGRELIEGGCG